MKPSVGARDSSIGLYGQLISQIDGPLVVIEHVFDVLS